MIIVIFRNYWVEKFKLFFKKFSNEKYREKFIRDLSNYKIKKNIKILKNLSQLIWKKINSWKYYHNFLLFPVLIFDIDNYLFLMKVFTCKSFGACSKHGPLVYNIYVASWHWNLYSFR